MTGEELARLCFAARPILWAVAIIVVLWVASIFIPQMFRPTSSPKGEGNS